MVKRRNTISKEAVLDILTRKKMAMSQDAIMNQLEVSADRATIYRILNRLCEDGIAHKIVADDGKQYFAVCKKNGVPFPGNHFHFRCIKCETIRCLSKPVEFSVPRKYKVQQTNCLLIGVCKDCS
ncbi:MAG: Fur family transcriptional regulator [Ginsengibacter sp.]